MFKRLILILTFSSTALLLVLSNFTSPATAGPVGILIIFVLLYLITMGIITYSVYGLSGLLGHLVLLFGRKKPVRSISFTRAYYYGTVLASGPVVLIGLQSIGSVGFQEVLLVSIFVAMGCFYIARSTR